MYRLQIIGPSGQLELEWDPQKVQEKDPETLAALMAADQFLRQSWALRQATFDPAGSDCPTVTPHMAAQGRWLVEPF